MSLLKTPYPMPRPTMPQDNMGMLSDADAQRIIQQTQGGSPNIMSRVGSGLLGGASRVGSGLLGAGRDIGRAVAPVAPQALMNIADTMRFYQAAQMQQPSLVTASELGKLRPINPAGIAAMLPQLRAEEQAAMQKPMLERLQTDASLAKIAADLAKTGKADLKTGFEQERNLRKDYDALSKAYRESAEGYEKVLAAGNAVNPTGADDIALIFGFMKTIDPTSVVREGEFATAEQTAGIPARIVTTYNKLINGERLGPEQRKNFLQAAKNQFASKQAAQTQVEDKYENLASSYGLKSSRVVNRYSSKYIGSSSFPHPVASMSDAESLPAGSYFVLNGKVGINE